jgi:hypothetical protein
VSNRAKATFEITTWDPTPYDEPAEGPPLARTTLKKIFHGDIEAESTVVMLTCGREGYVATERVTGRLGNRSGTFVLQHGAVQGGDRPWSFGYVVPGSGTGDLKGLRGESAILHGESGATFTLDYDFE